eukprot:COSAG05_NODE_150_length_16171_cov_64.740356_3_plen_174_part_00
MLNLLTEQTRQATGARQAMFEPGELTPPGQHPPTFASPACIFVRYLVVCIICNIAIRKTQWFLYVLYGNNTKPGLEAAHQVILALKQAPERTRPAYELRPKDDVTWAAESVSKTWMPAHEHEFATPAAAATAPSSSSTSAAVAAATDDGHGKSENDVGHEDLTTYTDDALPHG